MIKDLVKLPSVKTLLHENMNGDGKNELLRLSLLLGNLEAVILLIQIPQIMELAEKNNFYETVWGAYGALDLRESIDELNAATQKINQYYHRTVYLFNKNKEMKLLMK